MSALPKATEPTMEEILASIRKIIADDQAGGEPAAPAPAPVAAPAAEEPLDLAVEAEPVAPTAAEDGDLLFQEEPEPAPEPEPPAPVAPEPVASPPPPRLVPPAAANAPPPVQEPAPLLSQDAGAAIAGAFANLSGTLMVGQSRTIEDLVRDMLKPMLKTWLDDNLPVMVERLVRAEIERVTRGYR